MDKELRINLLKDLLYIRAVEEKIVELYPEQEMRCPIHLSIGQEAVAVGVCKNLVDSDLIFSNHRSHAHYLAKGGNLKKFFAELYGKITGCSKSRGGSQHLVDLSVNFIGSMPIVGGLIPVATGTAFASLMKNSTSISVVFFGDAATEEGVFYESINFAKLKNLPILFVCENNLYSVYTPLHPRQPKRRILDIAKVHGLNCYSVDGNNVSKVYEVSKKAINKIRNGEGPAFIESFTYRWREHCGPDYDDYLNYRPKGELAKWQAKCPIKKLKKELIGEELITNKDVEEIKNKIKRDIDEAIIFGKSSQFPNKSELNKYVYAN